MVNELLEKGNAHVVQVNKLMGTLENFDAVLSEASKMKTDVCFNSINGPTFINSVLGKDKMDELKNIVFKAITDAQEERTVELEQLLGIKQVGLPQKITATMDLINPKLLEIVPRKAAIINQVFEAAVKDMEEQHSKSKVVEAAKVLINTKPELTIEAVKKMYHDECRTMVEIAKHFGVTKAVMNNFISNNHLSRTAYKKNDVFRDKAVEQSRKEKP